MHTSRVELSIVVPCYNEAENIPFVLERFAAAIKTLRGVELILVDNNSKDNTKLVLKKLLPKYPFARSVFEGKAGYGAALQAGLDSARGTYLCWTHADLQTDPADVVRAYELLLLQKNPVQCYVKGDRFGRPFGARVLTVGMAIFETIYLGTVLREINAQPNLFHKSFYRSLSHFPDDFSFDLFMLYVAKKRNLTILRMPVQFPERKYGVSSWNTSFGGKYKVIRRTVLFSFKLPTIAARVGIKKRSLFYRLWSLLCELVGKKRS